MIIYPPLIADTIPAFTATAVKIPFENNPAVVLSSIKGFRLIVKDYNSSKITPFTSGNYYKFQIAYYDEEYDKNKNTPFYYSSASIGRCVEKEKEIYITDLKENKLSEQASNPNIYNSF